jgi:hypothetical protein
LIITLFQNQINNFQQAIKEHKPKYHGRGFPLIHFLRTTSSHTRISWYALERSSILSAEVGLGPVIPAKGLYQQGFGAFWLNINAF